MNRHTTRLTQHGQEQSTPQQTARQQAASEFASAEEMLRHDAAQTTVPAAVAERLQESIDREPKPAPSFWRRLFGGA